MILTLVRISTLFQAAANVVVISVQRIAYSTDTIAKALNS
jgi:hypothetical protein